MSVRRRQFSRDYKIETVRLSNQRENIRDLAVELGIRREQIYRWRREFEATAENSFPGHGNQRNGEDEITRLKRELSDVKMERDILKKTVAIFSKHPV